MAGTETITLRLVAQDLMSGNVSKAIAGLDKLAKRGGLVGSVLQGVGQSMGQMLNPVALVANGIGMVTDYMQDSVKAASDQAEALSKVSVVFGEQSRIIEDWASTSARSMGLSKTAALDAAGSLGNLFDGLGLADDAGLKMSKTIVQLAADLGSFNNVATDEALVALKSGLVGETEPMRRFGSALSAARVEAYGFANGLYEVVNVNGKAKRSMTEANKVQARYALILEDTKNAQGDFARTADGLANSQKSLDAALADISVGIGNFLIGPAKDFTTWLRDLVTSGSGDGSFNDAVKAAIDLRAGIKDVAAETEAGKSAWDNYLDGLQAVNDVMNPAADEARDFRRSIDDLRIAAGLSEQAVVDAFFAFKDGAHLGVEGARKAVTDLVTSMILAKEETSVTTPLISQAWMSMGEDIEEAVAQVPLTVSTAMAGMKRSVRQAINGTLTTMDDMKGPWIEAWKEYARSAKDPFSQKAFENWLEKRAEKAVDKAREAAKEGRPKAARRWRELAAAFRDPVIVALTQINGSVIESMGIISLFKQQTKGLNNILPALGSVFGNDKDGGNGGHWKQTKNGVKWVEGNGFGATPYSLPAGGSGMGSGGAPVINVTHIGSMSEADGQRFARTVAPHINRELGRGGR